MNVRAKVAANKIHKSKVTLNCLTMQHQQNFFLDFYFRNIESTIHKFPSSAREPSDIIHLEVFLFGSLGANVRSIASSCLRQNICEALKLNQGSIFSTVFHSKLRL